MRIVLIGPPGAGKGTQSAFLAQRFGLVKISTGELFRSHVSEGTDLGAEAKAWMGRGELVPDSVTLGMIRTRLLELGPAGGFVLDGFPRNVEQAHSLDADLQQTGQRIDAVLHFILDRHEVLRRLSGRRLCRGCGTAWHTEFRPPAEPDVCDADGHELFQRDDDTEAAITRRLSVYSQETEPLLDVYDARVPIIKLDAAGPISDIRERVVNALAAIGT